MCQRRGSSYRSPRALSVPPAVGIAYAAAARLDYGGPGIDLLIFRVPERASRPGDMRAIIQRVKRASVSVEGGEIAVIGTGILAFIGIGRNDSSADVEWMAKKLVELRIFDDAEGKLNLSLLDVRGQLLLVSQFTLYGDCRKGRRPSYSDAAPPAEAQRLYDDFVRKVKEYVPGAQSGVFQAVMDVTLTNWGPVTLILESPCDSPVAPDDRRR